MKKLVTVFIASVFIATSAFAGRCDNATYREKNPYECRVFSSNGILTLAGGALLVGGAVAAMGMGGGGGGNSGGGNMPTLPYYGMVGGDVGKTHLAGVMHDKEYMRNFNQYNDIRLAYSRARGFTGRGSIIAVMDAGDDTWHGKNVAAIANGPVAPDAIVNTYKVVDSDMKFLSYSKIGDIIAAAPDANIYNASWNITSFAAAIRTRQDLINKTDINFVNNLAAASTERDAIFVWAAGNEGYSQSGALSAIPHVMPEMRGHFVNVVAFDSQTGTLADYSNACGVSKNWCITAPGNLINEHGTETPGTSFAAPLVSAAIAVIREAFPYMSATEVTQLLFATARDLGAPGVDNVYGHGMMDLERATRPVGAELVPLDENMSTTVALRAARVPGTMAHNIKSAGLKFAFVDSFGRAFETPMNNHIQIKNPGRAFAALRQDANRMAVNVGNLEIGMRENNFLQTDGFLKTGKKDLVGFVRFSITYKLGDVKFSPGTEIGFSNPRPDNQSMISAFSTVYSATLGLDAQYGDWRFSISAPDMIFAGDMTLRVPTGRAATGDITFENHKIDLSARPSIEYAAQYKFITTAFVDNPYGDDEFYVLVRGKIAF